MVCSLYHCKSYATAITDLIGLQTLASVTPKSSINNRTTKRFDWWTRYRLLNLIEKEMKSGRKERIGGAPNWRRNSKRRRTLREMLEMNSRFSQSACTAIPTLTGFDIPPAFAIFASSPRSPLLPSFLLPLSFFPVLSLDLLVTWLLKTSTWSIRTVHIASRFVLARILARMKGSDLGIGSAIEE